MIHVILQSPNCEQGSLSITFDGGETEKYCGLKNFDVEGANPTIIFDSQYSNKGNKFLCTMQAKKFDEYNCQCGMKNPVSINMLRQQGFWSLSVAISLIATSLMICAKLSHIKIFYNERLFGDNLRDQNKN